MNWGDKMGKVCIGKIVSTHGIHGEIRILSDFPYKEKAFAVGNKIIIDDSIYEIETYRVHKQFDMITLSGFTDINQVLPFMKKDVFILEEDLDLGENEILDEELISFKVLTNKGEEGIIKEIFKASEANKILRIQLDREILIPMNSPMVEKIDKEKKEITIHLIEGM